MALRIAPSILAADFGHLADEVRGAVDGGADLLHLDVMDGHFVPNLTIGPDVVAAVHRATNVALDVHLMITDPERYAPAFIEAGAAWVSIHVEACGGRLRDVLAQIRRAGAHPAVAINPDTPVANVEPVLGDLDMLLVMSVHPGFGGQTFIADALDKLDAARTRRRERGLDFLLEVDGGITVDNVAAAAAAGADVIVAGTAIFGTSDYAATIDRMRARATA